MTNRTYKEFKKLDVFSTPAHVLEMTEEQCERGYTKILSNVRNSPKFAGFDEDQYERVAVMYFERTKEQAEDARRNSGAWKIFVWEWNHGLGAVILWAAAIFVFGVIVLGLF